MIDRGDVGCDAALVALCARAIELRAASTLRAGEVHLRAESVDDWADIAAGSLSLRAARLRLYASHTLDVSGTCTLDAPLDPASRPLRGTCRP